MILAVTADGENVFQHFGQTQTFRLYGIENQVIVFRSVLDASDSGHEALAGLLKQNGVNTLLCGGIGQGAMNALRAAGIHLIPGVSGKIDAAVADYLNGTLVTAAFSPCAGHEHHDGAEHECSHH